MTRIIRALPRIFTASRSGFEDTSKILLSQKLVVVQILDTIQQGLWPDQAKVPLLERIREGKHGNLAGSTSHWASQALLAFRIGKWIKHRACPKVPSAEDHQRYEDQEANSNPVPGETSKMEREWGLSQTPENRYPLPCDWYHSMGSSSSDSGSADSSNCSDSGIGIPRKRRHRKYLPVLEKGDATYIKFPSMTFDIFNDKGNTSVAIVADYDSDLDGLVPNIPSRDGDILSSYCKEIDLSNEIQSSRQTLPNWEQDATFKDQSKSRNNGLREKPINPSRAGETSISDTEKLNARGVPVQFQAPLANSDIPKDNERAFQDTPEVSHFNWTFGLQKRIRGNPSDAGQHGKTTEENIDTTMEAIGKLISEVSKIFPNLQSEEPASGPKPVETADPMQIIGKDGRPSRLMPPSTIAFFKEEEKRSKLAAEAHMVYDHGTFLQARQGPIPDLEHPKPRRFLTVVDDLEVWMRGGRLGSTTVHSS